MSSNKEQIMRGDGNLDDEQNPELLNKLGLLYEMNRVTHVKTKSHNHPLLNQGGLQPQTTVKSSQINNKPVLNTQQNLQQKIATTISPSSTLSDKGIGSSVGSIDAEFRAPPSAFPAHLVRTDQMRRGKTGSLDSRTQVEYHQQVMNFHNHTRSNSDVILGNFNGGHMRSNLLEQSRGPMWNQDPRRYGNHYEMMTSLQRPQHYQQHGRRYHQTQKYITPHYSNGVETIDKTLNHQKKLPDLCSKSFSGNFPCSVPHQSHVPFYQRQSSTQSVTPSLNSIYQSQNDSQLMPPPSIMHQNQSIGARGRVNSDSSLATINGQQPGYKNASENGEDTKYNTTRSTEEPPSYVDHLNNQQIPVVKFPGDGVSGYEMWNQYGEYMPEARSASPSINGDNQSTIDRRAGVARCSTRSNPGERRKYTSHNQLTQSLLSNQLEFDLPLAVTSEKRFIGREWLFKKIQNSFTAQSKDYKLAVVLGKTGHGKTALIRHLVSYSYHGDRSNKIKIAGELNNIMSGRGIIPSHIRLPGSSHSSRTVSPVANGNGSQVSSRSGSQKSSSEDSYCKKLGSQLVAYHFCDSHVNKTCYVPEFVASVASQLTRVPQLTSFRQMIMSSEKLLGYIGIRNCIINPSNAWMKGIVEPLTKLYEEHKLPMTPLIIAIDALDESLLHKPDHGYSIFSFIQQHIEKLPSFIKIIVTMRAREEERVNTMKNIVKISIDLSQKAMESPVTPNPISNIDQASSLTNGLSTEEEFIRSDMVAYLKFRILNSPELQSMIKNVKGNDVENKLITHLCKLCGGCMLYLRMVTDEMVSSSISPKSCNFTVSIPVDLHEVYSLIFNRRFVTMRDYEESVYDIISVCMAALYPLTDEQLFETINTGRDPGEQISWVEYKERIEGLLSNTVVQTAPNKGRTFFHHSVKEWLSGQLVVSEHGQLIVMTTNKYIVDERRGHMLLAVHLNRSHAGRMDKKKTLELAHHVLKADMFRQVAKQSGVSSSENNVRFMNESCANVTEALLSARNLFYPSIKINKLLLRCGAEVNKTTTVFNKATPLSIACHTGNIELSKLMLIFNADVNKCNTAGLSPLFFASINGNKNLVELILQHKPDVNKMDTRGFTALLHSISHNKIEIAHILLHCSLYTNEAQRTTATQRALVAACMTGCLQLVNLIMTSEVLSCNVDQVDPINGETPLTAASGTGNYECCEVLIKNYVASVQEKNRSGSTPLFKAVENGHYAIVELLFNCDSNMIEDRDPSKMTPLILAARQGHQDVVEMLLTRGANMSAVDEEGLSALNWSVLQGHEQCVRSLLDHGAEVDQINNVNGRTSLEMAAFRGDLQIVNMLLSRNADVNNQDINGMTSLDRAIGKNHIDVVTSLLKEGAIIRPTSWAMAKNKVEILALLLEKQLSEAVELYKSSKFKLSSNKYESTLKQVGEPATHDQVVQGHQVASQFNETVAQLLLGLSRCQRKHSLLKEAEFTATRCLQLKRNWYEALYARARVLREMQKPALALKDAQQAAKTAPIHNMREIQRLVDRLNQEVGKEQSSKSDHNSKTYVPGRPASVAKKPYVVPSVTDL